MTTFNLSEAPNHPRDCLKQKAKHLSVKYHYLLLIMLLDIKKKKQQKNKKRSWFTKSLQIIIWN